MKQMIPKFNKNEWLILSMIALLWLVDINRNTRGPGTLIPRITWQLLLFLLSGFAIPAADVYSEDSPEIELANFAFANYLGTGFYTSSTGEVFVLKIPLSTTLGSATGDGPRWIFNYPVTIGTASIDEVADGTFPGLDDVSTLSVIPSLEFHYPVLPNWRLIPFLDLGIAVNLESGKDRKVTGGGIKSFVTFDLGENWLILGNRILYAEQESFDKDSKSDFAVFETGLDYNIPINQTDSGSTIKLSFYYINYYYLDDLVLLDILDARIPLENKNELGFTVSLPKHSWLPDDSRIGFGVQYTKNDDLYRLVIGAPFF